MANKYKFSDIYDLKSFQKGYDTMQKELIEIHNLHKKLSKDSGLKTLNKSYKQLSESEQKLKKLQKERLQQQRVAQKAREKEIKQNIRKNQQLDVEFQKEKEIQRIKAQRVKQEAKLAAQRELGIKQTKRWTTSINNGIKSLLNYAKGFLALGAAMTVFRKLKEFKELAEAQILAEQKLTTVLKERTGATKAQVREVIKLTQEQQKLGVVGDEVQIAGAQQFATFVKTTKSVKTLIPAMNNLLVQQKGLNGTQQDAVNIANLVGRAFQGQLGSLTRVGISFNKAQGDILKYGTEAEKAAALADIITRNVGQMNEAFAATDLGRIQQAENQIGDLKEEIGEGLIPVMANFKELTLETLISIRPMITDILTITKALASLRIETGKTGSKALKWLKTLVSPLKAIWKWNVLLIKGFKQVLKWFGLVESAHAKRSGKVRERVDELTDSFKALSDEQKKNALNDFNALNDRFKKGEITALQYADALNEIILNAQQLNSEDDSGGGLDPVKDKVEALSNAFIAAAKSVKKVTEEIHNMSEAYREVSDKGAFGADVKNIDRKLGKSLRDAFFDAAKSVQKPTFIKRITGKLFGFLDSSDGALITEQVAKGFESLFETISEGADRELENIQTLIDRQTDAIKSTQDLLEAEKTRINDLKIAGAAYDTSEVQRLQAKLNREEAARNQSLEAEKKAKQKQKNLDITQAIINTASATLKAFESGKNPIIGAILAAIAAAFGATQIAKIKAQQYATGTNYLELNGHPDGTDTIPIWADRGERIVPRKDNAGIPRTFPNSLLPAAVSYYLDSQSNTPILNARSEGLLSEIATNTKKDGKIYRNGKLYQVNTNNMRITYG